MHRAHLFRRRFSRFCNPRLQASVQQCHLIAVSQIVEREVSAGCQDTPGIAGQHHA